MSRLLWRGLDVLQMSAPTDESSWPQKGITACHCRKVGKWINLHMTIWECLRNFITHPETEIPIPFLLILHYFLKKWGQILYCRRNICSLPLFAHAFPCFAYPLPFFWHHPKHGAHFRLPVEAEAGLSLSVAISDDVIFGSCAQEVPAHRKWMWHHPRWWPVVEVLSLPR